MCILLTNIYHTIRLHLPTIRALYVNRHSRILGAIYHLLPTCPIWESQTPYLIGCDIFISSSTSGRCHSDLLDVFNGAINSVINIISIVRYDQDSYDFSGTGRFSNDFNEISSWVV